MGFKENIKILREKYGMTQKDFALIAGVSDKAISTWENGTKEPKMGTIQKIADHFGIKKSDLIEDNDGTLPTPADNFTCSEGEKTLVKKYRQLDDDGKEDVDDFVDMKLSKLQRKAEEDVRSLG